MADDRVHIRCDYCGGWKMLLKYYAGDGARTWDNDILDWLDSHAHCRDTTGADLTDLGGRPGFALFTDSDLGDALDWAHQNQGGVTRG